MATTINNQPAAGQLMAAYRPIVSQVNFDIPQTSTPVSNSGQLNFIPGSVEFFSFYDWFKIANQFTVSGTSSNNGTFTIVDVIVQPGYWELRVAETVVNETSNATTVFTPANVVPAIVYCDVYICSEYYKTVSRTQSTSVNTTTGVALFTFDIQNIMQEYFFKFIPAINGVNLVINTLPDVFCRFRTSSIDANGFVYPERPLPVQKTSTLPAKPGGGVIGNTFVVVNAALQHIQGDNLRTWLSTKANGTFNNALPLTNRPARYRIGRTSSDYYPIIYTGTVNIAGIVLNYKPFGTTLYARTSALLSGGTLPAPCGGNIVITPPPSCVGVTLPVFAIPNGKAGQAYYQTLPVNGDSPFALQNIVKPAWMAITVSGTSIIFSGTPSNSDIANNITVSFTVVNCSSVNTATFAQNINVTNQPTLIETSNVLAGGPGGYRDQEFTVGPSVQAGNTYKLEVYSHEIVVIAGSGDTPNTIAQKLSTALNNTTEAQWNDHGQAPAHNTPGFKPNSGVGNGNPLAPNVIQVILNAQNQFFGTAF